MGLCEWQGDITKLSQLFKDDITKVIVYSLSFEMLSGRYDMITVLAQCRNRWKEQISLYSQIKWSNEESQLTILYITFVAQSIVVSAFKNNNKAK